MESLKGYLLVATPSLLDPNFARTVLLMLDHNDEGAAALVLNRPTEATVGDVADQVLREPFDWDKPILLGGPVPGPLMVLHTLEAEADQEVLPGVYTCVEASKVERLIRDRVEPSLIVANYAGWGPGQLEQEIAVNSWLWAPATAERVFQAGAEDLWESVVRAISTSRLTGILGLRDVPDDPTRN